MILRGCYSKVDTLLVDAAAFCGRPRCLSRRHEFLGSSFSDAVYIRRSNTRLLAETLNTFTTVESTLSSLTSRSYHRFLTSSSERQWHHVACQLHTRPRRYCISLLSLRLNVLRRCDAVLEYVVLCIVWSAREALSALFEASKPAIDSSLFPKRPQEYLQVYIVDSFLCRCKPGSACKTRASASFVGQASGQAVLAWPVLIVAFCTTLVFLSAIFLSLFLLLRPLLKRLEALAAAAELAARGFEKASLEFEQASNVINSELPTTLDSVERASLEFEVLGHSLNGLTGGLKRSKAAARSQAERRPGTTGADRSAVEAIQESTANSMRKVVQDVSALTAALTPAMTAWRKRIGFITERFEAASKEGNSAKAIPQLPAAASPGNKGAPLHDKLQNAGSSATEIAGALPEARSKKPANEVATDLARAAGKAAEVVSSAVPVDQSDPQALEGAVLLKEAAAAAEKLTAKASTPLPALGELSQGDMLLEEGIQPPPGSDSNGSESEKARESRVQERLAAAQAVFTALSKAEEAALAAATASGELESALQQAERQAGGSWWSWNSFNSSQADASGESQESDGMAYPSTPFMAATFDSEDDEEGKSGGALKTAKPKQKEKA